LAATLKDAFGFESELVEGKNGIFDVVADGTMVFSKHAMGRFPNDDEVVAGLRIQGAPSSTP
jgi:predicted Rdx family selenoprotein